MKYLKLINLKCGQFDATIKKGTGGVTCNYTAAVRRADFWRPDITKFIH
jgi:hypothetical protein